ncbi:MAG TPA: type 4 pilus major pilin [Alphaproteobacteria bacterium]
MKQMNTRKSEAGFTLLELLLVVGVGALLLIGGIATYRLVSEGNKVTDTARMIMTIRNEAQNLSQGQGYDGVQQALVDAKVINDPQKNAFGGTIVVSANDTLTITIDEIPTNACRKLAMTVKDQGVTVNGNEPPQTLSDVTYCGGDTNQLAWEFP